MTLYDLATGHWTALQLFNGIWPLALIGFSSFVAGYWYGRRVEVDKINKRYEDPAPKAETCPDCGGAGSPRIPGDVVACPTCGRNTVVRPEPEGHQQ